MDKLSVNLQGALWMIASCAAATVMTTAVKMAGTDLPSVQIVFLRCLFGVLMVVPYLRGNWRAVMHAPQRGALLFRGATAALAINFGFYSLTQLPLSTATVLFFTAPLFIILLAVFFLRETVGPRRIGAVVVGFMGTLIVLRPDRGAIDLGMLAALGSAVCFAVGLVLVKRLSETERPSVIIVYTLGVAGIVSAVPAVLVWKPVGVDAAMTVAIVTVAGTFRALFDIRAYAAGEASFVAPFQYARLLMIVVAAYLVFAEVPDGAAIAGGAIIIGSTLYIAWREGRLGIARGRRGGVGP